MPILRGATQNNANDDAVGLRQSIYVRLNIFSRKAYLSKILTQAIHPHLKEGVRSLKLTSGLAQELPRKMIRERVLLEVRDLALADIDFGASGVRDARYRLVWFDLDALLNESEQRGEDFNLAKLEADQTRKVDEEFRRILEHVGTKNPLSAIVPRSPRESVKLWLAKKKGRIEERVSASLVIDNRRIQVNYRVIIG